ncbi:MAG TPA: hypothetical protein VFJ43_10450 [Bacteroidia bacterium]|nr:hypothetical protein [Bacteroidia bacterium]
MNKQEVFNVLDKNVKSYNKATLFALIFGLAALAGGTAMFFAGSGDAKTWGAGLVGGLGAGLVILYVVRTISKTIEKKTEHAKSLLNSDPGQLVWSYVFQQTSKGATTITVIMNFRDGSSLVVGDESIPNKSTTKFLNALKEINPAMHMGYSEEIEKAYKKKSL